MGKALSFFSDHTQIMNILTIFLIIVCFSTVIVATGVSQIIEDHDDGSNVTSWANNSNAERYSEEKLKELRIEMVKFQILSKLNLKEPPPTAAVTPSESSKETIEILLNEEEEEDRQRYHSIDREERLVIHAKNNGVNCSQFQETYCRMFQFDMSTTLNTSSTDLWIHSTDANSDNLLSLSISYSNGKEERLRHRVFHDVQKSGWNKIELPRIFLPGSWNDHFYYLLEVSGAKIEYYGDRRLFLMVTKPSLVVLRKRRDLTCDSNESCCLRPLRVSLSEIGFNWVLYPVHLEVNMCSGKCMMDHSKMKTHYERAMTKILENDSSLIESLGVCWTLCCKPKQMEAVRVIYNDTEGIIHDQYIPELTVKSCSCS